MPLTRPLASQIQQPSDALLTDGTIVTWNYSESPDAVLTLGALAPGVTRTIANPVGLAKGEGSLVVDRGPGATGVIDAWGDKWWFTDGTAITPSTIPGARDVYRTYCDGEYIYVTSAMRGAGVAGRGAVNPPAVIAPAPAPQAPVVAPVATAQTLQAELLELGGALRVESTIQGFTGTGYVTFFDTDGDEGLFRFPSVVASSYSLSFGYNRLPGAGSTTNWASINGGAEFEISLPVTDGFGTFTLPGSYTLHDGTNTLKIRKKDGFFLLDSATITPVVAAPAPAPTPAPAPAVVGGTGYPFGSRQQSIPNTHIKPNSVSNAQMDATIKSCYDRWKEALVETADNIVEGGYIVRFSQNHLYVSEGIGMGSIIVAAMAGYDAQAKTIFDGFLRVARARTAYEISRPDGYHNNPAGDFLLNWRAGPNGEREWNLGGGGGYAACDGDQDFIMGLLMAHKQWGSAGEFNYLSEARSRINAMKEWFHYPDGRLRTRPTENMLRSSDVMLGHFNVFHRVTGDSFWLLAKEANLTKLEQYVAAYSNTNAIIPDALIGTDTNSPYGPPPDIRVLDFGFPREDIMLGNAQRNPWRLGTAYLYETDPSIRARLKVLCDKWTNFIKADTQGFPERTATGYMVDGTLNAGQFDGAGRALLRRVYTEGWYPWGMIGPQLCAAMVDSSHQQYLNALWAFNRDYFKEEYYNAELQLIPMLVASGNWWEPA